MFNINDKIMCIKSDAGNEGKIAIVIGFASSDNMTSKGEISFNNTIWEHKATMFIRSLGSPFHSVTFSHQSSDPVMEAAVNPNNWIKLPDVTIDETNELFATL